MIFEFLPRYNLSNGNKVQSKALNHLCHELRTPLSVIKGNFFHLKRMLLSLSPPVEEEQLFEAIERQLNHLANVQAETDKLIRYSQENEKL
jgi:signal transduction histidine kinase